MRYKTIEASRELRLWIGQVIVPAVSLGVMIASNPKAREWISDKSGDVTKAIKSKFGK